MTHLIATEVTQRAKDPLEAKSWGWFKENVGMNNAQVRQAIETHDWDMLRAEVITRYHEMICHEPV
jgi:hypothetical protein